MSSQVYIPRKLEQKIRQSLQSHKVLLLFGTRRVGKTFMLDAILKSSVETPVVLNGEDFDVQEIFRKRSIANFKGLFGQTKLLMIDEAQAIPDVGKALKLLIDSQPELTILATGSSSLDLAGHTGEPLTGRQLSFLLFPIAQVELNENKFEALRSLDERLVFGSYPELFHLHTFEEKASYLQQLVQSYLLKDILAYSGIKHSDKIFSLLRLIAFQSGAEVSYSSLSNQLGLSKITVEHYLDLLSKVYIIYKLPAYSTNQRNEISKGAKWFFYDNGIRNAVVNDFRLPALRNDVGLLWESYIISERMKKLRYDQSLTQFYFWRTYQQQEIDLIELENGQLRAFEIKFSPPKKLKIPSSFQTAYPGVEVECINRDNYLDFIT